MENINQKAFVRTLFICLIIVVIVALVGIIIYFNFIKKDDNTGNNTNNNNKSNNAVVIPPSFKNTEYKTFDSKYSIKITEDNKMYLNDKELKEKRDRIIGKEYMQIFVDFTSSSGYITDMTFLLDTVNKVIMEQPVYEVGQEDIDAFGEYAKFSSRIGLKLLSVNGLDFVTFESEGPTEIYTTSWKKLGFLIGDIKSDTTGIYVCNNFDDNFKCINESMYDIYGNVL